MIQKLFDYKKMKHFKDWDEDWPRCRQDDYRLEDDLTIIEEANLSQENIEIKEQAKKIVGLVGVWLKKEYNRRFQVLKFYEILKHEFTVGIKQAAIKIKARKIENIIRRDLRRRVEERKREIIKK